MRKLRIGILSDSPFFVTGYATIASNIANILSNKGHDVIYFANGYMGQNIIPGATFEDGRKLNFTILGGGREQYFKDLLPIYTKQYNLDVLLILLDTFMLYPWFLQLDLSPAKVIFYYPSDGGSGMPLGCEQILKKVDLAVAMAKFGQKQVKDMYNINTSYIPHAVFTNVFYPLRKEEKLLLKERWGLKNKFIVGSVFRNQGRKMADRTIKAFALFARNNPDAILFLHTDPQDAAQVFDLYQLILRYKIENRVLFSGMKFFKGFTYAQMNEVYNLMDVFILTTSGEGFGIPIIEAMSCGVPVLATDYTTTRELVINNKAGLGIPLVGTEDIENPDVHENEILDGTLTGSWNVERGICSVKKANEALQLLKHNPKMIDEMGNNGRLAVIRDYDWNRIGEDWIKTIEDLGGKF
jgi:glycosyltransferase involved in cell wall biosynthesis